MIAPFYKLGLFGDGVSLIFAFITGIGFGFFLERAGFGNARLLAAQFYFRDLRVLKVMFTAIITAMVGLYVLSRLGLMDLSLISLTPTFLAPQIVGGLILGVGFIIGGYCPGSSCVSAATGRIDGMVYIAGMIGGLVGFTEVYQYIEHFAKSTGMGKVTLPQFFNVPYGVMVLAVIVMAIGAFIAAEWVEKKIGGKEPGDGSLLSPKRVITPVRAIFASLAGLGLVSAFAGSPYRNVVVQADSTPTALTANVLADWLIEGRNDFLLVDVRDVKDFAKYHIPGARNIPLVTLTGDFPARADRIVFYGISDLHAAQTAFALKAERFKVVYVLSGGLEGWKNSILFPTAPAVDAPAKEQIEFAKRAAIAKHFGGAPRGVSDPASAAKPAELKSQPPAETPAPPMFIPVEKYDCM